MLSTHSMPARRRHRRDFRPSLGDHFAGCLQFERRSLPQSSVFGARPSMGVIGDLAGIDAGAQPLAGAQAGLLSVDLPTTLGTGMMPNQSGAGVTIGRLLRGGGGITPDTSSGHTFSGPSGGPLEDQVWGYLTMITETTGFPTVPPFDETFTTAPIPNNSSYISTEVQLSNGISGNSSEVVVAADHQQSVWGAAVGLQAALNTQIQSTAQSGPAPQSGTDPYFANAGWLTWSYSGSENFSETINIDFTAPTGPNVGLTPSTSVYIDAGNLEIGSNVSFNTNTNQYVASLTATSTLLPQYRQNPYGMHGQVIYQTSFGPNQQFTQTFSVPVPAQGPLAIAYQSNYVTAAGITGNETIPKETSGLNWSFSVS
jgi:hypothetical protein